MSQPPPGDPTCICPGCQAPTRTWTQWSTDIAAPSLFRGYGPLSIAPVPVDRRVTINWMCARCNVEWTTTELEGHPGSRTIETVHAQGTWQSFAAVCPPASTKFFASAAPTQWSASQPESVKEPVAPKPPIPDFACLNGSVIGYRAWSLKDWQLYGTGGYGKKPWTPGINEAKCATETWPGISSDHTAPYPSCDCGLYALARFAETSKWWHPSPSTILGAVEAWADVDETGYQDRFFLHANGFRSQYARIVLLATGEDYPRAMNAAIRALAAEHGADVCDRKHLEDAAKEHGQLIPDELLEWAKGPTAGLVDVGSGGGFIPPMWTQAIQGAAATGILFDEAVKAELQAAYSSPFPKASVSKKGIKQTLRTVGPPSLGRFKRNDRVKDSRGVVWCCVKGGEPGSWTQET